MCFLYGIYIFPSINDISLGQKLICPVQFQSFLVFLNIKNFSLFRTQVRSSDSWIEISLNCHHSESYWNTSKEHPYLIYGVITLLWKFHSTDFWQCSDIHFLTCVHSPGTQKREVSKSWNVGKKNWMNFILKNDYFLIKCGEWVWHWLKWRCEKISFIFIWTLFPSLFMIVAPQHDWAVNFGPRL